MCEGFLEFLRNNKIECTLRICINTFMHLKISRASRVATREGSSNNKNKIKPELY